MPNQIVCWLYMLTVLLLTTCSRPIGNTITTQADGEAFPLVKKGQAAPIFLSADDHAGLRYVAEDLQADIERVTEVKPALHYDRAPVGEAVVIVGTLGKSPLIDQLVRTGKLDTSGLSGRWEMFVRQGIERPLPGVERALVIAGSDKRGTIYGMYTLSEQIGVSPWYWWADVPPRQQAEVSVATERFTLGEPAVKYRGIFINDEAPALSGWTHEKFGGFNAKFYENVFELILRLKGNYLWPAMWGRAFYDDDPQNPVLANAYGVVIGTSHHEPLMRAHDEWRRYGEGAWNYNTNKERLQQFWRESIRRMGKNESIVSIGMRGDGDEPMTESANIALLERIVADQREILAEETGRPVEETPQLWALYKEVQEYYDKGMRVPDDVTLLLCDDNWGNIRKLPALHAPPRKGGYGIYYHFDYVGGPRNYKWLNTNPLPRVWEQMHLAYEYGAREIWIVNVGDIKPMELPTSFFLDYAWDPEAWPVEKLPDYTPQWAARQFGGLFTNEITHLLREYTRYNGRRKPELLSPTTYSLTNYREAERIVEDYHALARQSDSIYAALPERFHDAYYQLVHFPILACANLNELYVTAGRNHWYAGQGRAATNELAERVKELFVKDSLLTKQFHEELADGKWNHMMAQTHIGYTYWQQPEHNNMPKTMTIDLPAQADMGVAIPGSKKWWPAADTAAVLPSLSRYASTPGTYFDIFNRGAAAFTYQVKSSTDWLLVSPTNGTVDREQRVTVGVDWAKVPANAKQAELTVTGPNGQTVKITVPLQQFAGPPQGFVELNGYVAIEAPHFHRQVEAGDAEWRVIEHLGRTDGAVTPFPVTATPRMPGENSPRLVYDLYLTSTGTFPLHTYLSPTLNFHDTQGLRFAVSLDDQPPQIINLHAGSTNRDWNVWVSNNINRQTVTLTVDRPGPHQLRVWMIDPGVVLQRLVLDTGGLLESYLGPGESWKGEEGSRKADQD